MLLCAYMRGNFVIGKPTVLFLLLAIGMRNAYFVMGTGLLMAQNRARSASDMRIAPSEAGGWSID
jgi:hypothetical protein